MIQLSDVFKLTDKSLDDAFVGLKKHYDKMVKEGYVSVFPPLPSAPCQTFKEDDIYCRHIRLYNIDTDDHTERLDIFMEQRWNQQ